MIDDKKIEEATRDYIDKNGYLTKYDEDSCVDIEFAYKDGAKWAINEFLKNLWHDAEEKPNMELIVEPCHALPCELETFTINGKAADSSDFGDTFDHNEKRHYGCGDMRFEPQSPTKEVLAKYNITEEEYNKICDELEDKLCVGSCGWCV